MSGHQNGDSGTLTHQERRLHWPMQAVMEMYRKVKLMRSYGGVGRALHLGRPKMLIEQTWLSGAGPFVQFARVFALSARIAA